MKNYPKLSLLIIFTLLAYIAYMVGVLEWIFGGLGEFGYISLLFAGLLFSFGFTTPFAIAYFLEVAPEVNILFAALIAAFGASVSDMGIFRLSRFSFSDEFSQMRMTLWFQKIYALLHHERISEKLRRIFFLFSAGLIIASPLPDEIGVTLLSGMTNMKERSMGILCFSLNFLGIFFILLGALALA